MEQWKDIPGYEGIYQASTHGRLRTVDGKTTTSVRHGIRHWRGRILKTHYCLRKGGERADERATLWKNKKPNYWLVSRLIALTWCAGYVPGMTVNHIDGDPSNNCAENLEWVTIGDNIRHGFRTGLFKKSMKGVTLIDQRGQEIRFVSQAEASRFLGRGCKYVNTALRKGKVELVNCYRIKAR